jgi:trk system potassium uptake protein TrkA
MEVGFNKNYNVVVLTTIKQREEKNSLGSIIKVNKVQGVASSKTLIDKNDILVMYGLIIDIENLLKE